MRITRPYKGPRVTAVHPAYSARARGFTLLELSAVVTIIAVLVSLLCAALDKSKAKALRITCLGNMKALQLAWDMYTEDHEGALPLNQTAGPTQHHRIWARSLSKDSWVAGNPVADTDSTNLKSGTFYPTYARSLSIFRCPMDGGRTTLGTPRTRSYSMNAFLGGDPDLVPAPKYYNAEISRPESTFVFVEEHEDSLWGSSFVVVPSLRGGKLAAAAAGSSWVSTPADRHSQGCNISFADGHIEHWTWRTPKDPRTETKLSGAVRDLRDLQKLQAVSGY